jgi:uncharacterized protein YkwD
VLATVRLRTWSQQLGIVAVLAFVAAALLTVVPARALAGPNEGDFFGAANAARSGAGLPAYSYAGDLAAVARAQAERMAASGQLYHNPDLGGAISNWQELAENVGTGTDWQTIQQALMDSADHRAAILDSGYTQMGVGTAVDKNGTLWVSEVFRMPAGATATAPSSGSSGSTTTGPVSGTDVNVAPAPSPTQILREKIRTAREKVSDAKHGTRAKDPLAAALQFSTVMDTVGG